MHKELDTTLHSKRHDSSPPAEPKPANQRSERSDSPPKDTRTPRPAQRSENKWRRELSTYGYSCLSERLRANAANSRVSEYQMAQPERSRIPSDGSTRSGGTWRGTS